MAFHAVCSCVVVAALRFLSVDAAIEDRSIASIPAHKRFVLNGKGRLDVAIRQLPVGVPCMQNEIAVTAIECEA